MLAAVALTVVALGQPASAKPAPSPHGAVRADDPPPAQTPGLNKNQWVRLFGFGLFAIGAAMFTATRRARRRAHSTYDSVASADRVHRPQQPDVGDRVRGA